MLEILKDGGVWAWVPVPLFLAGLVVITICGVLAVMGRKVPAVAWYLFPGLVVIWAELGASVGYSTGFEALQIASDEAKAPMSASAQSMALGPLGIAYYMFGISMLWSSFLASISCVRVQGAGSYKPLRAAALLMVWLLACGTALCTPVFGRLGILPVAVALCLFVPSWFLLGLRDAEEREPKARLMFARGLTVWMIAAGCLACAFAAYTSGQAEMFKAVAMANALTVRIQVYASSVTLLIGFWIGVGGMVTALLVGLVAFGKHIRLGAKTEDLVKAGLMFGLVALWIAMLVLRVYMGSEFLPIELKALG